MLERCHLAVPQSFRILPSFRSQTRTFRRVHHQPRTVSCLCDDSDIPREMSHHRHASSSSYAPVLINPSSDPSRTRRHSMDPVRPTDPKLRYPYPLPVLACLDLGYTTYHAHFNPTSWLIIALCVARCFVLIFVLGASRRWRTRGGFVAVVGGFSVGLAVWTLCKSQLEKGKMTSDESPPVHAVFLTIVSISPSRWRRIQYAHV